MPAGIILADTTGKLVRFNPANEKLWGPVPPTDSVDGYREWKGWWADMGPRHGQRIEVKDWAMARALRGEVVHEDVLEIEPFDQPGLRKTVVNSAAPVRDAQGHILGAVVAQPADREVMAVEQIVDAEVETYAGWLRGAEVAPTVAALRARADDVVSAELRRLTQRRADLTDEQRAEVAHTVHGIVQRLLHQPTVRVRQLAAEPGGEAYAQLLRDLFDLSVIPGSPEQTTVADVPDVSGRPVTEEGAR